jgi:hypothetical protein
MRFTFALLALAVVAVSAASPAATHGSCTTCKSVFSNGVVPKTNFVSIFNAVATGSKADAELVVYSFPDNSNGTKSTNTITVPAGSWMEQDILLAAFHNVEATGTAFGNKGATSGLEVVFDKDTTKPTHYGFAFYGYNSYDFNTSFGGGKAKGPYGFGIVITDTDIAKVSADGLLQISSNLVDSEDASIYKNCKNTLVKDGVTTITYSYTAQTNSYVKYGSGGANVMTVTKPPPCTVNCTAPVTPTGISYTSVCNITDIAANSVSKVPKTLFASDPSSGGSFSYNSFTLSVWSGSTTNAAFPIQYQLLASPTQSSSASTVFVTVAALLALILAVITPKMF